MRRSAQARIVTAKRRLPLIQASAEPEPVARSPWQWSLFGAALIGLAWLVLALLLSPVASLIVRQNVGTWSSPEELSRLLDAASPAVLGRLALENLLLQVVVVGIASVTAGFVVGRYGPGRGIVTSAASGGLVAVVAVASTTAITSRQDVSTILTWGLLVLVPWASGTAALGAWRGSRDKRLLAGP